MAKQPSRQKGTYMKNAVSTKNALVAGLENACNYTHTENAALTYKSTLCNVLDFFGMGGALRKRQESEVTQIFSKAFAEDKLMATKALFYIRDVRGGQGERKTFRTCLNWLARNHSTVVQKNLKLVAEYGRWDDLFSLFHTPLEEEAMKVMANQLRQDWKNMRDGESVSLLAKWLKSENTSSKESVKLAHQFRNYLKWTPKKYRKTLSTLRRYIDVVEVKMCANQWNDINLEGVPSKAQLTYRKAFEKRAAVAYKEYLERVEKGEAKINASALFPYDILRTLVEQNQTELSLKAANLQWKALPNFVEGGGGLVIADCSGSMNGLPLYVAVSLAIYFAEKNEGPFKDVFLTFSMHPCFHRLVGSNLLEKYQNLDRGGWDGNTNIQAAFDLILSTAKANKVAQEDMPTTLYIVSDMEFDYASGSDDKDVTNYEAMKAKFAQTGYKLPNVVWWHVDSRQDNVPVKFSDGGVAIVSGSHPSILKKITNMKSLSPLGLMFEALNDKRYDAITV